MKSIRVHSFGGPEVLKLEEVPDPTAGPGELLIGVHAIGVNPVETYIRAGKYGPKEFPFTPGTDAAGVVESVGAKVKRFKPGDRVYTSGSLTGTYASKTLCAESRVFSLPAKIPFAQGAALGVPYGTAHRALFHRARPIAGETILIHGASGAVGIASTQLACAFGLTVFGTGGTEEGRKLVRDQGAHHVLDHKATDYLDQLVRLTEGKGVDIVLEMAAHVNLGKDLTVLARNGRVIVIGSRGPAEIDPRQTMMRDADIRGMTFMNVTNAELAGIGVAINAGLVNGSLRPVIREEIKLSDASTAHQKVLEPGALGKIVLVPD